MRLRSVRWASLASCLCLGCVTVLPACRSNRPRSVEAQHAALPDNPELRALFVADQADRVPQTAPGDWQLVSQRDRERQARVRELLDAGALRSGRDYYHAAMVYQHAEGADGVQLAHELALIGACLGDADSRWLAAASYDRLLMNLERPQRFATQYRSNSEGVLKLYEVSAGVTDAMRAALNVPTLSEARAREREMQEQLQELGKQLKAQASGAP